MNELKNLIALIEKRFNENIADQYAKSYEESEISAKDTLVINRVIEYINSINTFKSNCTGCREYSDTYHYNNTSEKLANLISSIDGYILICNNIVENIEKASKEAYREVYSEFSLKIMDFDKSIHLANQYYEKASSARRTRNNYSGDDPEYRTWNNKYSNYKKKCQDYIANASDVYNTLSNYINNEGIKKVASSVPVSNTLDSISYTSTSPSASTLNKTQYGSSISREFDYSEDGSLEAVTTVNDNLGKITTTYNESGLATSHTIYDKNGNLFATFECDENGNINLTDQGVNSDEFDVSKITDSYIFTNKNTGQEYWVGLDDHNCKQQVGFYLLNDDYQNVGLTLLGDGYVRVNHNDVSEGLCAYNVSGENSIIGISTDENNLKTVTLNGGYSYSYDNNKDLDYTGPLPNGGVFKYNNDNSYRYDSDVDYQGFNFSVKSNSKDLDIGINCHVPNEEVGDNTYRYRINDLYNNKQYDFTTNEEWLSKYNLDNVDDETYNEKLQQLLDDARELDIAQNEQLWK